jgi:integrase
MKRLRTKEHLQKDRIEGLPAGEHHDGGGLFLRVDSSGARRWVQRITIKGREGRVKRGLGPYPLVTLEMARDASTDMRRAAREGRDLAHERRLAVAKSTTFKQAFDEHFENRRKTLSNEQHIWQWRATMETYIFPRIGSRPVADITHAEIIDVLKRIWHGKPVTARRLLQRIKIVFKSAILKGQRERANPCEGVAEELGRQNHEVRHQPAMPYREVPGFVMKLRTCNSNEMTKLAFEWLILTATRSDETRGALKAEVLEDEQLWVIPKERMKGRVEHVVPLPPRCLEILAEALLLRPDSPLLFPSPLRGKDQLSDAVFNKVLRKFGYKGVAVSHGFRSSFRDWATEVDKCREVVAEAALAHAVPDKTEAAYRRAKYPEERVGLMQRWAVHCAS